MKNPMQTLSTIRTCRWILIPLVIASFAMADEDAKRFDLFNMDHPSTGCEKAGVILGVCYGRTDEGQVSYAVFYDGSKPSPFAAKIWFSSNGEKGVKLDARHDGERIDPPDPAENILLILDDKIVRGHFEPMKEAKFQEFLSQKKKFTVADLEAFSKQVDGDPAPEKTK